ncbi:MAG: hypothetical protein JNK82_26835 [Myxococcaceae bacterium]|nr:hypothetical protein [Myxococcaceae bacterium]
MGCALEATLYRVRWALTLVVLSVGAGARAQTCPDLGPACPGNVTTSCGKSSCDDAVSFTRTSSCDDGGTLTSCFVRSSTGQSCSCLDGPCVIDFGECPNTTGCGGAESVSHGPQLGVGCRCSSAGLGELLVAAAVLRGWASARRSPSRASRPASRGRG